MLPGSRIRLRKATSSLSLPPTGTFVVGILILVLGFYILVPVALILINSFNVASIGEPSQWSLDNWRFAFAEPAVFVALRNTFLIFGLYTAISFPVAVAIAWTLARTNIAWSHALEFAFWISFMIPTISVTIGWTLLLDPGIGFLNKLVEMLPLTDARPFNIYSVEGIIWVHLMANATSGKVMLLTPAFRNMNLAMEEAARVSGATNLRTAIRVTLPLMTPAMVIVFMLQFVRIFQSFETEQILGTPIGFFIYSTKIYEFVRYFNPPEYGAATALASVTLLLIAVIYPTQRWLTSRRQYTTLSGQFKPGLIDLGRLKIPVFLSILTVVLLLTIVPIVTVVVGSFMNRVGWFNVTPVWTLEHWQVVLSDRFFLKALRTTLLLSATTAIVSPLIFSVVAYIIVRTPWRGRGLLETILWTSSAVPGILAGLGLLWMFLGTPFLAPIYGTIFALLLVVTLQGQLTSTQLVKAAFLQIGSDMEEAARVSGAGWVRTYLRIWLPLIMPTLVLIGTLNFVFAAGATASIILLASRDTITLAILALEMMTHTDGKLLEEAGIVSLFIVAMTVTMAVVARTVGLRMSVSHNMRAQQETSAGAGTELPVTSRTLGRP